MTAEDSETVVLLSDVVMLGLLGDAERSIEPEKMPRALTVIVETAVEPCVIVRFGGVDMSSKLGRWTDTANKASWEEPLETARTEKRYRPSCVEASVERVNVVVAEEPGEMLTFGASSVNTGWWGREEFVSEGLKLTGPEKFWKLVRFSV